MRGFSNLLIQDCLSLQVVLFLLSALVVQFAQEIQFLPEAQLVQLAQCHL
jgi:hypothetical protein